MTPALYRLSQSPTSENMPRRSTRARRASSRRYSIGDIVEIRVDSRVTRGLLAAKMIDASPPDPRWSVTFEEDSLSDREIYERDFGGIVGKAANVETIQAKQKKPDCKRKSPHAGSPCDGKKSSQSSTDEAKRSSSKKSKTDKNDRSRTGSKVFKKNGKHSSASAREQRSRRRQKALESEPIGSKSSPVHSKPKKDGFKEVVPYKTGTLILHKDKPQRAQWIWKV